MLKINPISIIGNETQIEYGIAALEGVVNSEVFIDEFEKKPIDKDEPIQDHLVIYDTYLQMPVAVNFEIYEKPHFKSSGIFDHATNTIEINNYRVKGILENTASVIGHELMHKFEFKDFDSTAQYSIPYQVGNTVLEILRKHPYKSGKKLVYVRPWWLLWLFKIVRWR